jgi:hypothetical protein
VQAGIELAHSHHQLPSFTESATQPVAGKGKRIILAELCCP